MSHPETHSALLCCHILRAKRFPKGAPFVHRIRALIYDATKVIAAIKIPPGDHLLKSTEITLYFGFFLLVVPKSIIGNLAYDFRSALYKLSIFKVPAKFQRDPISYKNWSPLPVSFLRCRKCDIKV